jgi:multiple sugar transport system permease protein/putative aldouronate transport system permease protein
MSLGDRVFMVFVYALLIVALVAVLYPMVFIVSASFSDARAVSAGRVWLWPVQPTLMAYEAVFNNPMIVTSFMNSVFYMVFGTAINLILTVLAAYGLSRKNLVGRGLITGLLIFTMLFSGGIIPSYLLMRNLHLTDTRFALLLCGGLSVWNVVVTRTYYQTTIPEEMHEASTLDGCDEFNFLARVALPLSGPILAVMALYYAVGHWNSYFNALMYIRKEEMFPLQIVLRNILVLAQIDTRMIKDANVLLRVQGLAELLKYSVSVISTVPLLIVYPFVQKYFIKGVMVGALKG